MVPGVEADHPARPPAAPHAPDPGGRGDAAGATAPFLQLTGDPFELGRQHGAARAAALHDFLADGLARTNHLRDEPVPMTALLPMITAFQAEIEAGAPDLAEEIRGLAEGAGLTHPEALLLQMRREIVGYRSTHRPQGDCTTYARVAKNGPDTVLAQTVDLNGNLDDQTGVLSVRKAGSRRDVLVLSFGGLLGYLGMNSDGLAVGINLVLGGRWRAGLPPYLAVRHVLDNAGSVAEGLEVLRGLRLASSRSLMLCDRRGAAYAEFMDGRMQVVEGYRLLHTNHFLHREFIPFDELNVFAKNGSLRRLEACGVRLNALAESASPRDHLDLLSTPPIFVPDNGDIRRERTVAVVVMRPAHGDMHLLGPATTAAPQVFTVEAPGGEEA
ncbi:C45 family autoproteolytic acyltransferase/hydolase [Yinghuangia sp. YIM S09857]|uniref:C45 family autoproteolytic acyltransferase/hydolase n=1 Tax=Yinghuangia sp. YIM S09857 TaxID=3436929 RepID=UPI003F52CD99